MDIAQPVSSNFPTEAEMKSPSGNSNLNPGKDIWKQGIELSTVYFMLI